MTIGQVSEYWICAQRCATGFPIIILMTEVSSASYGSWVPLPVGNWASDPGHWAQVNPVAASPTLQTPEPQPWIPRAPSLWLSGAFWSPVMKLSYLSADASRVCESKAAVRWRIRASLWSGLLPVGGGGVCRGNAPRKGAFALSSVFRSQVSSGRFIPTWFWNAKTGARSSCFPWERKSPKEGGGGGISKGRVSPEQRREGWGKRGQQNTVQPPPPGKRPKLILPWVSQRPRAPSAETL